MGVTQRRNPDGAGKRIGIAARWNGMGPASSTGVRQEVMLAAIAMGDLQVSPQQE